MSRDLKLVLEMDSTNKIAMDRGKQIETEIESARTKPHVSVEDFVKINVERHIIKQKTGGQIVGEIVGQNDIELRVKINIGTITIPRDNIESMEVKLVEGGDAMSPQEVYTKKLEQINQNDPEAHFLLGLFCLQKNLDNYSEMELKKACELDELYQIYIDDNEDFNGKAVFRLRVKNTGNKDIDEYEIIIVCKALDGGKLLEMSILDKDNIKIGQIGGGVWKKDINMPIAN